MEQNATEYKPGDRLEVRYGRDNKWLPCTLNSLGADEQYIVKIFDTEKDVIVNSQRLRRPRHIGLSWREVQDLMDERGYYICPNACGQRINCTKSIYYKYHYGDRCANLALPAPAARGVCRAFDCVDTSREQQALTLLHTGNVHQRLQEQFVASFDDEHHVDMNMDTGMDDAILGGVELSPSHGDWFSSDARGGAALYQKWLERDGPKGSVQWFIHRLRQPIYKGSSMKVYDFVQWAVHRKLSSNMSRSEFEEWLRMVAATAPSNAIIPASWHIMKSIINLPDLEDYISHACVCHQYRYPRITKDNFEAHRYDKCPRCNEPRFLVDAGGRLQPRHWVWYLGLDNAIQQLFNDPEFTSQRGKSRTLGRWGWYGSKYAEKMNNKTNGALFHANNSAYSLFIDGFQPFAGATYTSWVIVLRCEDLDLETRSKRCFHLPIMIIPGPRQPKFSYIYLDMIANDFQRLGPDGPGMEVHPATGWHEGALVRGAKFIHRALLSGNDADSPAMWWTGEFIKGANAYNVCNYCKFNGVSEGTRRVYPGYNSPVLATRGLGEGKHFQIGVRDDLRYLSHKEQCTRASMVVADPSISSEMGCTGLCVFVEKLNYTDYSYMFRLPIAHNFLLGLVKNFWRDTLRWMPGGRRKPADLCEEHIAMPTADIEKADAILQRGLLLTSDFNRGFNGLHHLGDWKAEDWWRFTEVYSPFIQKSVIGVGLPPVGQEIWENLRTFVMHHLQPPCDEAYSVQERIKARKAILEVGRLAEKYYRSFLTHNLHKAACFAHAQEDMCGMLSTFNELWGERALMPLKRLCRNARVEPEKVMANACLARMCLRNLALQFSVKIDNDVDNGDFNSESEKESHSNSEISGEDVSSGEGTDSGSESTRVENNTNSVDEESDLGMYVDSDAQNIETGLQGAGREATEWEREIVFIGLKTLIDKEELGWSLEELTDNNPHLSITIFSYAFIHKSETITSEIYKRSISRESCNVKATFGDKEWIGRIAFFANIEFQAEALELAFTRFYLHTAVTGTSGAGKLIRVTVQNDASDERTWEGRGGKEYYPMLLSELDTKVIRLSLEPKPGSPYHHIFFNTYKFQSGAF